MKVIRTRMFAYLNPRRGDLFATAFARQVAEIEAGTLDRSWVDEALERLGCKFP